MRRRLKILIGVALLFVYIFNPLYIRSNVFDLVSYITSFANLAPVTDPNSLKAAVTNVTADFDQLANFLQDFFERLPDDSTEVLFRDFLSTKASRRHKELERYLDWVLGFYRFAWPFLIVYIILRLSGGSGKAETDKLAKSVDRRRIRKKVEEVASEAGVSDDVNLPNSSPVGRSFGSEGRSLTAKSYD